MPQALAAPAAPREASWEDVITAIATREKVNPQLALAVAMKESSLDPNASGDGHLPGGAVGLFQLRPGAAEDMGVDRSDPIQNITGGIRYLRTLADRYRDEAGNADLQKVLQAYNGGADNVDKGTVSPKAQAYAAEVLAGLSRGVRTQPPAPAASPATSLSTGIGGPSTIQQAPSGATMLFRQGKKLTTELASGFDPRTAEGRENLAATIGAGALTYATMGTGPTAATAGQWIFRRGVLPWIARSLAAPTGAAVGAGTERVAEDVVAGRPPDLGAAVTAGAKQGAMEAGGQVVVGLARQPLRAALATKVARQARQRIGDELRTVINTGRRTIGAAREKASDLADAVSEATARGKLTTLTGTPRSGVLATSRVPAAEMNFAALANTPPSLSLTEQALRDVLAGVPGVKGLETGPAARAMTEAGQRVRLAAEQGPELRFDDIRALATQLGESLRPTPIVGRVPQDVLEKGEALKQVRGLLESASPAAKPALERTAKEMGDELARMEGALEVPNLPGLLGLIENGPDSISSANLHKLKMLLDEAVNWDETAKKHLERITKGLRGAVRDRLGEANPAYNQATAAYEALVPLYRRGAGRALTRALANDPDKVVGLLTERNPLRAQALRKLLIDQSAAGGDRDTGEVAWNLLRSHYTYRNLIEGGPAGLTQRVQRLVNEHPDFARTLYGDKVGQDTLSNLAKIGGAYDLAVGGLQQEARSAKRDVARLGQQFTTERERVSGEGRRLMESSLGPFLRTQVTEGEAADVVRAIMLGPTQKWGAISGLRLILNTPKTAELIEWAAQSDSRTRAMTRALFTPLSDRATAAFFRSAFSAIGADQPTPMASHSQETP